MQKRKGLLSGTWYPDTKEECEMFIASASKNIKIDNKIFGGIVPHAGWFFSGETAKVIIEALSHMNPDLVIVFGMHMPEGAQKRIMTTGVYETPLGILPVCGDLVGRVAKETDFAAETPDDFEPDNTIEVQLPLIRHFMGEVEVFCCGLPPDKSSFGFGKRVGEMAVEMGRRAVVIGSTDLTHYGPSYGFMPYGKASEAYEKVRDVNDRRMIGFIEKMDYSGVISDSKVHMNACCSGAVAGAIGCASALGAKKGVCADYSNSYEKRKSDVFVGYAGIYFE
ncbi:MAG: AmmeMemoRadiSam system protein B [Desulfobacteraceae bacterium]|nr:AmmeMemoRadiSam system protein B [Desulfobacteraceae bacterium]